MGGPFFASEAGLLQGKFHCQPRRKSVEVLLPGEDELQVWARHGGIEIPEPQAPIPGRIPRHVAEGGQPHASLPARPGDLKSGENKVRAEAAPADAGQDTDFIDIAFAVHGPDGKEADSAVIRRHGNEQTAVAGERRVNTFIRPRPVGKRIQPDVPEPLGRRRFDGRQQGNFRIRRRPDHSPVSRVGPGLTTRRISGPIVRPCTTIEKITTT